MRTVSQARDLASALRRVLAAIERGDLDHLLRWLGGTATGPIPHTPFIAFIAVVIMNVVGPVYAWLNVKLTFPYRPSAESTPPPIVGEAR